MFGELFPISQIGHHKVLANQESKREGIKKQCEIENFSKY